MAFRFLFTGQTGHYLGCTAWDCGLFDTDEAIHRKGPEQNV